MQDKSLCKQMDEIIQRSRILTSAGSLEEDNVIFGYKDNVYNNATKALLEPQKNCRIMQNMPLSLVKIASIPAGTKIAGVIVGDDDLLQLTAGEYTCYIGNRQTANSIGEFRGELAKNVISTGIAAAQQSKSPLTLYQFLNQNMQRRIGTHIRGLLMTFINNLHVYGDNPLSKQQKQQIGALVANMVSEFTTNKDQMVTKFEVVKRMDDEVAAKWLREALQAGKLKPTLKELIKNKDKALVNLLEWNDYLNTHPEIQIMVKDCSKNQLSFDDVRDKMYHTDDGFILIEHLKEEALKYVPNSDPEAGYYSYNTVKSNSAIKALVPSFNLLLGSIQRKFKHWHELDQVRQKQERKNLEYWQKAATEPNMSADNVVQVAAAGDKTKSEPKTEKLDQSDDMILAAAPLTNATQVVDEADIVAEHDAELVLSAPVENVVREFMRFLQDGLPAFEGTELRELRSIASKFIVAITNIASPDQPIVVNNPAGQWEQLGRHVDQLTDWTNKHIPQPEVVNKELGQIKRWVDTTHAYVNANGGVWGSTVVKNRMLAEGHGLVVAFVAAAIAFMFATKRSILQANRAATNKVINRTMRRR